MDQTSFKGTKEETFVEETDVFVPPDGGYGWCVALGAFIALMWTSGTVIIIIIILCSIDSGNVDAQPTPL